MNDPRQAAFAVLTKMQKSGAYSTLAVDSAAGAFGADSTARAFFTKLVYGVTERQITLDYVFSRYLTKPIKTLKPEVLTALRMGTYQLLYLERVPDSAAVNESVKLVKENGFAFAAGLVNAVLRNVARDGANLPQGVEPNALSVRYSAPVELVNLLCHHYGRENTERFLHCALEPKRQTVRVNTLKTTPPALMERLQSEGAECEPTRLPDALYVSGSLTALPAYAEGLFHTEDVASQLCAQTLGVKPGDTFIDLCAAPGGKTFTAAELMNDEGTVIACELHPQRAELIRKGAERLGLTCIQTEVGDAALFDSDLPLADAVLCDVPCSGLGVIGKKPEIKYKNLDDVKELLPVQFAILCTGSRYVKRGGRLVYSTCSVNPAENRKICDRFLAETPDFHAVPVLPDEPRAVDEGDYITLFPHIHSCDGFFIAAFERD